ncbi:hypothetical protein Scep_025848 [Stephania cephalantha]|uniref:Uncharacterized protein n=1 Tax=Stephania cephalantha TaxID=152367 RepID=A0AAP0HPR1_9MAGN
MSDSLPRVTRCALGRKGDSRPSRPPHVTLPLDNHAILPAFFQSAFSMWLIIIHSTSRLHFAPMRVCHVTAFISSSPITSRHVASHNTHHTAISSPCLSCSSICLEMRVSTVSHIFIQFARLSLRLLCSHVSQNSKPQRHHQGYSPMRRRHRDSRKTANRLRTRGGHQFLSQK